jgi:hypothetical protein
MAADAARISQAKRFRRSLAAGPTTLSDSPIDGWRSKRGPPACLAAAVAARSPGSRIVQVGGSQNARPSISRGMSMRPRVFQARCRIEADGAAIPSRQPAGQCAHALPMHRPVPMRRLAARFLVVQERTTRRPTRSLAGEGGRGVMSRLSAPSSGVSSGECCGIRGTGSAGKGARMQESARKGFRFRDLSAAPAMAVRSLGPPTTLSVVS